MRTNGFLMIYVSIDASILSWEKSMQGKFLGLGVAMGAGIGAAIGASTGHIAQWEGVGVAVGVALGLFMSRAAKSARVMKLRESTWSPFQSPEVREICAHLTPTERARLLDDARQRGSQNAWWIALPASIATVACRYSWRLALLLLPLFAVYFMVWGLPRLRAMRRRTTELLCQTEWARSRGHTPDRLRLMTFPWSR